MLQGSCDHPEVTILHHGGGLSACRRAQRYCYVYSLRRNQDTAPRMHYCFLTAPPLLLYSLPSLISNCLNLPFGTQGRSRRLNESYFLQIRNGQHKKDLHPGGAHRVLLCFTSTGLVLSPLSPRYGSGSLVLPHLELWPPPLSIQC